MSWLDRYFERARILVAGVEFPPRAKLNFIGGTITDNPGADQIDLVFGEYARATATIPDATTASLEDARGVRTTLTRFRVQSITLPDGTSEGQTKTVDLDGDVYSRTRVLNGDGSTAAVVGGGRARLAFIWDATQARWNTSTPFQQTKIVRPEDFGDDVGIGDASADTAAFQSMLSAVEVALAGWSETEAAGLRIDLSAPEYLLNEPIVFPGRWGWGGYEVRGAASAPGNARVGGTTLRYVGAGAVIARRQTVTFNRAARTAVLSAGTWAGLGFTTGMRLFPQGTANNNRFTKPIASLSGATATFEAPTEATVSGFSTTGMNPSDETSVVCDLVQFVPFVTIRAAWGVVFKDLKIWNATAYPAGVGLCSHALWVGMEADVSGWESSSGVRLEHVDVYGAKNAPGCSALLIGRAASNPVVGQQCDNIEVHGGFISATPVLPSQPISVSGDTITTTATAGGAAAPHTFEDHQPVVVFFDAGGTLADGLECRLYYARDVNQGAGTLKVSATPGGAAITTTTSGGLTQRIRPAYRADCVYQADGNNTKGIRFHEVKFNGGWSAFRCPAGFENLVLDKCGFDSLDSWAVDAPNEVVIRSAIAERINKFARSSLGRVHVEDCAVNAISLDDDWNGISGENIRMVNSTYIDSRSQWEAIAIDTATDTLTVNVSYGFPPVNGRRLVLRSSVGVKGLPDGLAFIGEVTANDFYVRDVAHVAGDQYTFRLAQSIGGSVVDIASNGCLATGGRMFAGSELVPQAINGDTRGASVVVEQCTLTGSGELRIAGNTLANTLYTADSVSIAQLPIPQIYGRGNRGGPQGFGYRLADVNNETLGRRVFRFYQPYIMQPVSWTDEEQIFEGDYDKWNKHMGDPTIFFTFPIRVHVTALWAEVVPDRNGVTGFAGTGVTDLTCSLGVYSGGPSDGTLLPAFDLMAYSAKVITNATWAGNVATFTAAGHKISAGDFVTVAGVNPAGYNTTARATVLSSFQFSVPMAVDPGAFVSGGTVTVHAASRRRGMEAETRGTALQSFPWRPVDLGDAARHWTTTYPTFALTLVRTGGSWSALTSGRLRLGIRMGRFSR